MSNKLTMYQKQCLATMTIHKRNDEWWIKSPYKPYTDWGPYETRQEAESEQIGLARTFAEIKLDEEQKRAKQTEG